LKIQCVFANALAAVALSANSTTAEYSARSETTKPPLGGFEGEGLAPHHWLFGQGNDRAGGLHYPSIRPSVQAQVAQPNRGARGWVNSSIKTARVATNPGNVDPITPRSVAVSNDWTIRIADYGSREAQDYRKRGKYGRQKRWTYH